MSDKKAWYATVVNKASHHGKSDFFVKELRGVLYPHQSSFSVVKDDDPLTDEYFIFVKSAGFVKKREEILRLQGVLRTVDGKPGCPYSFSDKEVDEFISSIKTVSENHVFSVGDVVVVSEGYLSGLTGIVVKTNSKNINRVFFRFHVRTLIETIKSDGLKFECSIYDAIPRKVRREDWLDILTRDTSGENIPPVHESMSQPCLLI